MEELTNNFLQYLDQEKENTLKESDGLFKDGRSDEGKFLKIKANMYDIFKALFNAAKGQCQGDIDVCKNIFLQKADMVPQNWKQSLELAKEHNEVEKIITEELKLKTAEEILAEFQKLTQ